MLVILATALHLNMPIPNLVDSNLYVSALVDSGGGRFSFLAGCFPVARYLKEPFFFCLC